MKVKELMEELAYYDYEFEIQVIGTIQLHNSVRITALMQLAQITQNSGSKQVNLKAHTNISLK